MLKKIKNIILKTDRILYKKFGSDKSTKILENIKEAQIIFSHLDELGKDSKVRFVGGCVRKAILGEYIDDIDLATSLTPEEVKIKLIKNNIKVLDTGILHGTVTAIVNEKKFEITTLRKDVTTDGRHASVEFTQNWEQDASRRDFTINAIYSDIHGRIFDPHDGINDLKKGVIKFIGLPEERIQEDYLRILRYFRFFTQYSKTNHDPQTILAIKKYINGINKISNERIYSEINKILKIKNVYNLFSNNISKKIILNIFPQFKYYERLKNINTSSDLVKNNCSIELILSLLIIDQSSEYEYFCHKFKISNKTKDQMQNISKNFLNLKNKKFFSRENIKKIIYLSNRDYTKDLLLFTILLSKKTNTQNLEEMINYIETCDIPKFPISGEDLKNEGYKTGIELGKKLKSLEEKWIKNNFILEKK
jgi:poly(A) polymerase